MGSTFFQSTSFLAVAEGYLETNSQQVNRFSRDDVHAGRLFSTT